MDPTITSKNVELTSAIRSHIERKLGKINRLLNNIKQFDIVVGEEKTKSPANRYMVQLTVDNGGTILRSEERASDIITATDKVEAVITDRIEHYKGKFIARRERGNSTIRRESREEVELPPQGQVVKTKSFDVKPMPVDEAIEQMELLGHDFFLFRNAETSRFNLVYRRRDGNYGLIEARS